MPYSKKYNCFFFHIPKCAGSSIEHALEIPFNNRSAVHGKTFQHMTDEELKYVYEGKRKKHLPDDYDDLFKFTFIRNPWDRLVSEWKRHGSRQNYMRTRLEQMGIYNRAFKTFDEWAEIICNLVQLNFNKNDHVLETSILKRNLCHWGPQWRFCTNIDFMGRFENLKDDWAHVCDEVGLKNKKLPHSNKSGGKVTKRADGTRKSYQEFYSDETRELVGKTYAKDIEMFGYTFEE